MHSLREDSILKKPEYMQWIVKEDGIIENLNGTIYCYKIEYNDDPDVIDSWALHIRRHYISDDDLEEDCDLLELSPEEYLKSCIIPQKNEHLGSTARSNTITEILISDLIEYILGYHVPRCRQENMSGKTVSEHGTDVIGYKFKNSDKKASTEDRLVAAEVKAILSKNDTGVITNAVNDSFKDEYRVSLSLNYLRKKLKQLGKMDESKDILRFQTKTKVDYSIDYIAAGITSLPELSTKELDGCEIQFVPGVDGTNLVISKNRQIFFVHGKDLMKLTHQVYERCIQ